MATYKSNYEFNFTDVDQIDVELGVVQDSRGVIHGKVVWNAGGPVVNAVVKLFEVDAAKNKKPITHTFTDNDGQFMFGPLCKDRNYEIKVWKNDVKCKCAKCTPTPENYPCLKPCCEQSADEGDCRSIEIRTHYDFPETEE